MKIFNGVGIRTKLLLATLVLLAIPLVGVSYVREMERFLRNGQEQAATALARAAATALHDRPTLLEMRAQPPITNGAPKPNPAAGDGDERWVLVEPEPASTSTDGSQTRSENPPPAPLSEGIRETALPEPNRSGRRVTPEAMREIELIIRGLGRNQSRIWVIDQQRHVLALTGSLKSRVDPVSEVEPQGVWARFESAVLRPLYTRLLSPPSEDFDDAMPDTVLSTGREIDRALTGVPASRWRNTNDERIVVVSAAHPVWSGDEVIAAVVAEETTLPVLSVRYRAFEELLTMTLGVFILGATSLFLFASGLSRRLLRLRDQAEGAIDAQGRVQRSFPASTARDEIGDLSRSFATVLDRLAQYNQYLERMADRLSHELRTPIAVVASSLENLRAETLPDAVLPYIGRAEDGVRRLNAILTRMREATRLEQMLREVERERFDLCKVVSGCVGGYSGAFPNHRFALQLPPNPVWLNGAPDLIAQLLDKVIDNATDFSPPGEPIEVSVNAAGTTATLAVSNVGPSLPATMQGQLFESMITVRDRAEQAGSTPHTPHLGLGLFMVRLIAQFHGARAAAHNRADDRGVAVEVTFPTA